MRSFVGTEVQYPGAALIFTPPGTLKGDDNKAARPHPIVDRTMAKLSKEKPSNIGLVTVSGAGLIKCEVAPQSVDRPAVILPRIVWGASSQEFQLVSGEGAAHFKSETEAIGF